MADIGMRYPGSKAKLVDAIVERFPDSVRLPLWQSASPLAYHEPFFGAGAVGISILKRLAGYGKPIKVFLSDIDYGLVCYWNSVKTRHEELCHKILEFRPSAALFYKFKEEDGQRLDAVRAGFQKLALHQMSYSGLGARSGGPLGGRKQGNSKYFVDARWQPELIVAKVERLHKLFRKFKSLTIGHWDFEYAIRRADANGFIYLDPPYYQKGPALYKHAFGEAEHVRLAGHLKRTAAQWALSYDDHPRIRQLYPGRETVELAATYTMAEQNGGNRPKNKEILILKQSGE